MWASVLVSWCSRREDLSQSLDEAARGGGGAPEGEGGVAFTLYPRVFHLKETHSLEPVGH